MNAKEMGLLPRDVSLEYIDALHKDAYKRRPNSDLEPKPKNRVEYVFGYACPEGHHTPVEDLAVSFSEPRLVESRICGCGKTMSFQVLCRVTQPVWAPVIALPNVEYLGAEGGYRLTYLWAWQFSRELSCVTFEFDRRLQTRILLKLAGIARCLVFIGIKESIGLTGWLRRQLLTTCESRV